MKLTLLLCAALVSAASAFAPLPLARSHTTSATELQGWLDFKPFHGHGSGEDDLDEQWEAQQAILAARRSHGLDKQHLQQKYKNAQERTSPDLHSMPKEHFMWEDDYVDEKPKKIAVEKSKKIAVEKPKKQMKFFWEK